MSQVPSLAKYSDQRTVTQIKLPARLSVKQIYQNKGENCKDIYIDASRVPQDYLLMLPKTVPPPGRFMKIIGPGSSIGYQLDWDRITIEQKTTAERLAIIPTLGTLIYDTTLSVMLMFNGTSWVTPGGVTTFTDDTFGILNAIDNTKKLAFDVSGVSPATTRTITMPDSDADLTYAAAMDQGVTTTDSPTFIAPLLKTSLKIEDPGVGTNTSTLQATTLTADRTVTFPDSDVDLTYAAAMDQGVSTTDSPTFIAPLLKTSLKIEDPGVGTNTATLQATTLTADRTVTFPDSDVDLTYAAAMDQGVATTDSPTFIAPLLKTSLKIEDPGAGTNTITIDAPAALAGNLTMTLPGTAGSSGNVLSTNGSGVLSWSSGSGSVSSYGTLYKYFDSGDYSSWAVSNAGYFLTNTAFNKGIWYTMTLTDGTVNSAPYTSGYDAGINNGVTLNQTAGTITVTNAGDYAVTMEICAQNDVGAQTMLESIILIDSETPPVAGPSAAQQARIMAGIEVTSADNEPALYSSNCMISLTAGQAIKMAIRRVWGGADPFAFYIQYARISVKSL